MFLMDNLLKLMSALGIFEAVLCCYFDVGLLQSFLVLGASLHC